jgi:dCTP deaminase
MNMLKQIATIAVAPELEKISAVDQQEIPESIRFVCGQLRKSLELQVEDVEDIQDLTALRVYLSVVSLFTTLVLEASPNRSSWWAEPLIRECYRLCEIDSREVLIIHSRVTSLDEFSVYTNILESTILLSLDSQYEYRPLDIFVIPAEVKFDISLMALIGHEVGHVYWQIKRDLISEKVKGKFQELTPPTDLLEILYSQRESNPERIARHIEEYLCDQVGRFLLGPAFDFALLKLFYSLPSQGSSDTHPPEESRVALSREQLGKYVTNSDAPLHVQLQKMQDALPISGNRLQNASSNKYDQLSEEAAQEIYDSSGLRIDERFSLARLETIRNQVFPELDGFRPPFETVNLKKPLAIAPSDAIVGTTIYFYGEAYKESNQFYIDNEQSEKDKQEILRKKLVDHLMYAISLHEFVKFSHEKINYFKEWNNNDILWGWREREQGGKQNAFIVTPTIDCKTQYSHNSVDLRLGSSFLVNVPSRYTHIDPAPGETSLSSYYQEVHVPVGKKFILHPHQFILASILEYVCLPYDYYALVLGRSTWGRLGLNIATATTVQAGYRGCLTLELRNLGESPLPLRVGTRVAQLCLVKVPIENTGKGYFKSKGKYIGPVAVGIPRIHDDPDWNLLDGFKDFNSQ